MPTATAAPSTFSPLGFVTASAVMGKDGEPATRDAPGSRLEYDLLRLRRARRSRSSVRSDRRVHHVTETDVPLPERDETIETVEYSDGFGRLLQTRTQAEDVLFGDPTFGGGVSAGRSVQPSRAMRSAGAGSRATRRT